MTPVHPGDRLDQYRIESVVARSGMASIFRATDMRSGRPVAIKVPHPEMESDPVLFDRFRREEQIGVKLDHPGVMKVWAGEDRSQVYMVMEWVEGRLLRQVLAEQAKLSIRRAVKITIAICDALEYIHSHGVVHRDLKPENVMIDAEDRIKIIDFGIAGQAGSRRLTFAKLSQVMGTPEYISPEQVKGKRGDGRSDIFALGVMFYEMLTGKDAVLGAQSVRHHERPAVEQPHPAVRSESGDHRGAAGDYLSGAGARSEKPLRQRPRVRLGLAASGPGRSGRAPRDAGMEAPAHSVG